jgi:T6SS, Transcription factor, DNA binding domain
MEPADRESVFWIPSLQPEAVLLSAVASARASAAAPVDLMHLPGLDLRRADDGWHGLWRAGGTVYQFWLTEKRPDAAAAYTLTLPLDALFELRAHAARRLWRVLHGRSPGRPFRAMPDQLRELHILTLRALDARQCGESYRTIAEALLGFRGTKTDWEGDPRKNKARRLVASGQRMMRGGYRTLLHYPIKLPRR